MDTIIDFILRLLGRERTIENITAGQDKIVRQLERHADRHKAKRAAAEERAARQKAAAHLANLEASDAEELASNWKNSGLIRPSRKAA